MKVKDSPNSDLDLPLDRIILGDCVAVMESLPEDSVDVIFADPP